MNVKILGAILLAIGLAAGFAGAKLIDANQVSGLSAQVAEFNEQQQANENLRNQIAELKSQFETLNVNELYGVIKVNGSMKAYKIGDLNTMPPLVVNDVVGKNPVVVSWCPLCGTLAAYNSKLGGKTLIFSAAGARKIPGTEIENLHLKDDQTGSVWAQGPGIAVEGPEKGTELQSIPVQLFNKDVVEKMGIPVYMP